MRKTTLKEYLGKFLNQKKKGQKEGILTYDEEGTQER